MGTKLKIGCEKQLKRNYMIDYVKCFAIFFVVAIHSKTVQEAQLGVVDGDETNFIINTFARFAVPFFFVASGYLFVLKLSEIQRENGDAARKKQFSYMKKYIFKLVKLYIAWFAFYFMFDLAVDFIETEKNSAALSNMLANYMENFDLWNVVYFGKDWPERHLWFLPALIWATLILFLFIQVRLMRILLVISAGLHVFGLLGQSYSFLHDISINTRDGVFFALFYVTLGGVAAKYASVVVSFARKIPTRSAVIWFVVFSLLQVLEGFITLQLYDGKAENYFLSTIPLVMVLFLLVLKHSQLGRDSFLTKIGANAVGIYVSHVFIMESIRILIYRMDLTQVEDTFLWKVVFTPIVFILAYIFYHQLQDKKRKIRNSFAKNRAKTSTEN